MDGTAPLHRSVIVCLSEQVAGRSTQTLPNRRKAHDRHPMRYHQQFQAGCGHQLCQPAERGDPCRYPVEQRRHCCTHSPGHGHGRVAEHRLRSPRTDFLLWCVERDSIRLRTVLSFHLEPEHQWRCPPSRLLDSNLDGRRNARRYGIRSRAPGLQLIDSAPGASHRARRPECRNDPHGCVVEGG